MKRGEKLLYYASKISDNISKTPEGFLLCRNVPIARIGKQDYLASELPLEYEDPNQIITVYRDAADVFSEAALASFEGKPTTNEHPMDEVTPYNASSVAKGHAQNIRQGGDYMIADLFITDALLIVEIENGKREVSCGYSAHYEMRDGKIYQTNITGNHIAIVESGRAGEKVSIRDTSPQKIERKFNMKNKKTKRGVPGALANLMKHFSRDALPEDVSEAVEELIEAVEESVKEEEIMEDKNCSTSKKDEQTEIKDVSVEEIIKKYFEEYGKKLDGVIEKVEAIDVAYKKDKDPLEKLEEELTSDTSDEEDVVVDPELINEIEDEEEFEVIESVVEDQEGPVMPNYGKPKNPLNKKIKDEALKEIRKMKPIIASIKDPKERKTMADSMANLIRASYGISAKKNNNAGGYKGIMNLQQQNAKTQIEDSKKGKSKMPDFYEIQKEIEESRLGKK